MKKVLTVVMCILCLSMIVFTFSLSFTKQEEKQVIEKDNIVMGIEVIPQDLTISNDEIVDNMLCSLFQGIVKKDENGDVVPSLCEEYSTSEDGLEYKFKMKENIKWSNGEKITPREISKYYTDVISDKDSDGSKMLSSIYGYDEYVKNGNINNLAIEYSNNEIKIRLNKKDEKFLENLTSPKLRIARNYSLNKDIISNCSKIVSSGPYYIKSINSSEIDLMCNKNYYKQDELVENIKMVKGSSQELVFAYYKTEKVDICFNPPINGMEKLESNNVKVINDNNLKYVEISPNLDKETRKNIYYSIQKDIGEYENLNKNKFVTFSEVISSKSQNTDDNWIKPVFNDSISEKNIYLLGEDNDENRSLVSFISKNLSEDLGITLNYDLVNKEDIKESLKDEKYDLIINDCQYENKDSRSWASSLDKSTILFNDKKTSELYTKYKSATDEEERKKLSKEFISYMDSEEYIVPLYYSKEVLLTNDESCKLSLDKNGNIDYEKLVLTK